jgi:ABC-type glycerol-3-phosphate transport system substrate-binding protein
LPFAITRTSPHFEQALDFLRFMAGQEQNEKLNRIIGWMPSVKGTELDPALEGVRAAPGRRDQGVSTPTWAAKPG